MGWKDFFYYSKSERRVIILLMVLLGLVMGIYWGAGKYSRVYEVKLDTCFVDSFMKQLEELPRRRTEYRKGPSKTSSEVIVMSEFDPNTADSLQLRTLGIRPFVIRNILRYRAKGGVFRTPEAFSRVYGLDKNDYLRLKPYLAIAPSFLRVRDSARIQHRDSLPADSFPKYEKKYEEGIVVNLNMADTSVLKRIPGIGSGLAKMIVAYRERLGGFCKVEQLQEVPHVGTELNRWFVVTAVDTIRKIRVNHSGLEQLRNHPYMNFYKARMILEYRRKRGKIEGLPQLSLFKEFTEEDLKKLAPYLSFE